MPENKQANGLAQRVANLERAVAAIKAQASSSPMPLDRQFITPERFAISQSFKRSWGRDKADEIGTVRMWGRRVVRLDRAIEAVEAELRNQNEDSPNRANSPTGDSYGFSAR